MSILPRFSSVKLPGGHDALAHRYASLAAYPALLYAAWRLPLLPPALLQGSCALFALFYWQWAYRRYRAVADTPTARAASAALGYCELYGTARAHPRAPLASAISGRPCLWFGYRRAWQGPGRRPLTGHADSGATSTGSFLLVGQDGGEVVIEPERAEVRARHRHSWMEDGWRITETWIADGDPLYALGEVSAIGGAPTRAERDADFKAALEALKRDPVALARFDADGNRELDLAEWDAAREAVGRDVDRRHRELAAIPVSLHLAAPADGRPFIVAAHSPSEASRGYRRLAWLHAASGLATLAALPLLAGASL